MKTIFIIFIIAGIVFAIYSIRNRRSNKTSIIASPNPKGLEVDAPISFGYKCMWIAVKTDNREKIAEILGFKNVQHVNWKAGIDAAYKDKVFITPKIGEWTLIVGLGLSGKNSRSELDEVESYKKKINALSKEFGEAQFFATHRVIEYHAWAKSIDGKTVRFYSYVGEKAENILIEGRPTSVESKYNLINTFSEEAKDEKYFERKDIVSPDEDLVMKIAADWSIAPTAIEERKDIELRLGLVGQ